MSGCDEGSLFAAGALSPERGSCGIGGFTASRSYPTAYLREVGWMPQVVRPVRGLRVL